MSEARKISIALSTEQFEALALDVARRRYRDGEAVALPQIQITDRDADHALRVVAAIQLMADAAKWRKREDFWPEASLKPGSEPPKRRALRLAFLAKIGQGTA